MGTAKAAYDDMKEKIDSDDGWAVGALLRLYEFQTADEQAMGSTVHDNGLGFNGLDAPILSSMAEFYKGKGFLTPRQLATVRKMICKYINQLLGAGGIHPASIKKFTPKNGGAPAKATMTAAMLKSKTTGGISGMQVKFNFPKGDNRFGDVVSKVKSLSDRRWVADEKYWKVGLSFENVDKLFQWGFEFSKGLQDWYDKVTGKAVTGKGLQRVVLGNEMALPNLSKDLADAVRHELTFVNPEYEKKVKLGIDTIGTPKHLKHYRYKEDGGCMIAPRGFCKQFLHMCEEHGVQPIIDDQRTSLPNVDFKFTGKLKPFQEPVVKGMLGEDFGSLSAPTGSGKTVMALAIIAARKQPVLIVVHTKELLEQWVDRATTFLGIPEGEIGVIGGGEKRIGKRITIALVQSLYKCADEVAGHIGFLVVDECHRAPSRTFTEAVKAFNSRYMLGLSATPWRRDNLTQLIFFYLGETLQKVKMDALVESGDVMKAEVITRKTFFKPVHNPVSEYSKMLSELTKDPQRNKIIADDIVAKVNNGGGTLLVLTDRKKHCDDLRGLLAKQGVDAEVLVGSVSKKDRTKIVERLDSGEIKVLIATGQLIGEGFDCKRLSVLFLATPIKFNGRLIQYLGRILRTMPGKETPVIYDYVDMNVYVLVRAFGDRQKVYAGDY